MDLIAQFVSRYRKEFDFYEQACRMVAQVLDTNLQSAGVRGIVTSRAKNPARLETKIRQRAAKNSYSSIDAIYEDIVDLAGVRVALYFPAEREEVGKIIKSLFVATAAPKEFPTAAQPSYKKRFSGYWATHYRVYLPESLLNDSQKRYSEARVEIQVASVLMHAWSEVEHDLVYKPMQGQLSPDEYAILDELNGLVLAGEIALERLQRAGELRVSAHDRKYSNHYDLASSLLEMSREKLAQQNLNETVIGRVDLLFCLLKDLDLNTPDQLAKYVAALHTDLERRPISEQVIDQILTEDTSRYATFDAIRTLDTPSIGISSAEAPRVSHTAAIGEFMSLWIEYEHIVRTYAASRGVTDIGTASSRLTKLVIDSDFPIGFTESLDRLRRFRNQLVHGIEVPDAETIRPQIDELRAVVGYLRDKFQLPTKEKRKTKKKDGK